MRRHDDLALALRLSRRAAEIALEQSGGPVTSEIKADGSPVTAVDLAIEAELIRMLGAERPDDAVLSEECGGIGHAERRWLLDPLDGTSMFAAGRPGWGTLVTLQERDESVVAVVTRPLEELWWWAVRGEGTFCGRLFDDSAAGESVRVSGVVSLDRARVAAWGDPRSPEIGLLSRLPGWTPESGDNFSSFVELMSRELDAIVSLGGLVWDHAPTALIVEEAGGTFRDRRGGKRLDLLGGIYGNARLSSNLGAMLGWY